MAAYCFYFLMAVSCIHAANIHLPDNPSSVIKGIASCLNHPEGIAFSSCGEYIAVANAHADSISFYKQSNGIYENIPFFILNGPDTQLKFPHDLAFSPNGKHLAVANRYANLITIYEKNDHCFHPIPIARIAGNRSELAGPDGIKYSQSSNIIAVANSLGNTVTLYRYKDNSYEQSPYQILKSPILNTPDGMAFSGDGELLGVTNHGTHSVLLYQRIAGSTDLYSAHPVEILQGSETNLAYPHSLSFHPQTNDLAVSNSGGKKTLNIFRTNSKEFPRYAKTPIQTIPIYAPDTVDFLDRDPKEGGVKGVAFSRDGTFLGLCASHILDPTQSIFIYSATLPE